MRILVLGAYGLIGSEIVRGLGRAGHDVVGLGRSAERGRSALPQARWIGADIAQLTRPGDWAGHLRGIDAVVNASGALQDGLRDRLARVQRDAILALIAACEAEGVNRFVQISAPGAAVDASTAFFRTKAEADNALKASMLCWTILRPGLVIGRTAYGGTALLRMLAGVPFVQPIVLAQTPIQTVWVEDVADAVCAVLASESGRAEFDLVEETPHTLAQIVAEFRAWLGFRPARMRWVLPRFAGSALALAGDLAGWLGWRPALRTTALRVLAGGIRGNPRAWRDGPGGPLRALGESLAAMPATAQDRLYARAQLVFPALLFTLSAFWILSGAIGFWRLEAAGDLLAGAMGSGWARALAAGGSAADLLVGVLVLFRPALRPACGAAILISVLYLALGTWLTPSLWADPLGPFVKIFPGLALALACAALAEER